MLINLSAIVTSSASQERSRHSSRPDTSMCIIYKRPSGMKWIITTWRSVLPKLPLSEAWCVSRCLFLRSPIPHVNFSHQPPTRIRSTSNATRAVALKAPASKATLPEAPSIPAHPPLPSSSSRGNQSSHLPDLQRRVLACIGQEPASSDGAHVPRILATVGGSIQAIQKALEDLMTLGLIYATTDTEHFLVSTSA